MDLKKEASNHNTKTAFRATLKANIFERLFKRVLDRTVPRDDLRSTINEELAALTYDEQGGKATIRAVLLLFNIAALLQNTTSNIKFPFDNYKKEDWDIEHIRSVKSDKPGRIDGQKQWLENALEYWTGTKERRRQKTATTECRKLCNEIINTLDASHFDTAKFDEIYERILAHFQEAEPSDTDDGLANLALLDAGTNRSYKNAVFPVKRRRILALDKSGTFVPLCTTNVFLKYYSTKIEKMMFWSEDDRKDYFTAIIETLVDFFTTENGGVA